MPLSHDSKPSMRHRRQKYQIEMRRRADKKPEPISPRMAKRRLLQRLAADHQKAQVSLARALREVGVPWRALEVAVHKKLKGQWRRIDNAFLERLFEERGVKFKEAA